MGQYAIGAARPAVARLSELWVTAQPDLSDELVTTEPDLSDELVTTEPDLSDVLVTAQPDLSGFRAAQLGQPFYGWL